MTGSASQIPILMYHSISVGPGPTSIDPATFSRQLDLIVQCGYTSVRLRDIAAWLRGEQDLPQRSLAITFDDGFRDFALMAAPQLAQRRLTATVFLPTGKIGGCDDWEPPQTDGSHRPLMSWSEVRSLADEGFDFGAHGITHGDLSRMTLAAAQDEIVGSRQALEAELQRPVTLFAPPFGCANRQNLAEIRDHYELSVGTALASAGRQSDRFDLPRIEMHYFRNPLRWQAWLQGRGETYFALRQSLRLIRSLAVR